MDKTYASEMLEIASLAKAELHEGAAEVADFVRGRAAPDGSFKGRSEETDIYYTVFGNDCRLALGDPLHEERLTEYLTQFGDGEGLDLIHLGCLARCWSRLQLSGLLENQLTGILNRVEAYRSRDGGYHIAQGAEHGSIYGGFLAYAAHQDLCSAVPNADALADSIEALRMPDGLYASECALQKPTTNAAVGALLLLGSLGRPVGWPVSEWLLKQCHEKGGFLAAPEAPIPDLVSTATALFALRRSGADLSPVKARCINFLGSVWDDNGGFNGHWMDDTADCEYTFYALLSLGCLGGREAESQEHGGGERK